jgi:transcription elongation factor Elf1
MECPYQTKMSCKYVDTAGMDKTKECQDCEYNGNQEVVNEAEDIDAWNEFMMGL